MTDTDRSATRQNIYLYLITTVILVLLIGWGLYQYLDPSALTIVDIAISAILTAALVLLYFRQTVILESQRNLLTQELNREARQKHTETLRERVRIWHGNPDREIPDDPMSYSGMNLPTVGYASFESAPTGSYSVEFSDEEKFQVIPYNLNEDRYLQDLLDNHAPDLKKKKYEIESQYEQFVSLRDEFEQEFNRTIIYETGGYKFEPADYFTNWIFEFLVSYERGRYQTFNEIREKAVSQLKRGGTGLHPDEPRIWIHADFAGKSLSVYSAVTESVDRSKMREQQPKIKEEAEQLIKQIFDEIEADKQYKQINEAASVLNEAEETVRELEHLLIEYDGRLVYPGNCKYLEEAQIFGE